eukprot:4920056-Amphidinium_carterae.1
MVTPPGKAGGSVWVMGEGGKLMRTPGVEDEPGDGEATDLDFDQTFEWRGSYLDLEEQELRFELWNISKYMVNKFDSCHEASLLSYATGPVHNEVACERVDKNGNRKTRVKIMFNLYFQE